MFHDSNIYVYLLQRLERSRLMYTIIIFKVSNNSKNDYRHTDLEASKIRNYIDPKSHGGDTDFNSSKQCCFDARRNLCKSRPLVRINNSRSVFAKVPCILSSVWMIPDFAFDLP